MVRYARDESSDLDAIGATLIETPGGAQMPLAARGDDPARPRSEFRDARERPAPHRRPVQRRRSRPAQRRRRHSAAGRRDTCHCRPGVRIEYGGQFESESSASQQLLWLSLGVIVAIFFVLMTAFGSTRDALLVMLNLPLALIGGVVGVYLAGGVLSVASIVGFITLFGIATRNGIMLVSHIRHLQDARRRDATSSPR